MTPWSPKAQDNQRSTPAPPHKPKRYALQIWLEVEVGPGYFLPPEDDSCSMDFTLEVLNHAYPVCMGVYLDRGGYMLAFYGQKGSPKAGLIQEVAIEAGHAVSEIPTWMGLTAKWRVKCVSLTEAKDILAGCKRLEQENQRREHQYFQERLASLHQLQNAFYPFSSTRLCTMLFAGFSAVCWFSCFLSCHAQNVCWFGGIVVRGCTLRSLLGCYAHQELI